MVPSFAKTKIVATVGPSSNTKEKLLELIVAGVDVFRLNFSHGTHEDHQKVIDNIKELRQTFHYSVSILQDLQGPKIRIGAVENGGVEIIEGNQLIITTEGALVGTSEKVSCTYTPLASDVKAGDSILVDDGKIELRVTKIDGGEVFTKVIYGGILKSRKGVNLPDTAISESSLTKKDRKDLLFGLKNEVDWIAISFVRTATDVVELKNSIKEHGTHSKVVAKIERSEAIKHIDQIIAETDAVMVARGDLGVEINMADVPIEQKNIVRKCNMAAKPVIIATQMLESMIDNPRPTRAEANDVANAVLDGADAVMLSAETASGKFPVQAVQCMNDVVLSIEARMGIYDKFFTQDLDLKHFANNIIIDSACKIATASNAKAIVGMTWSGFTAFRIARHRPEADVFIFTANKALVNSLSLVWGVRAFYFNKFESTDQTLADIEAALVKDGHLRKGDLFVSTGTMPLFSRKKTNMVKINIVD